MASTGVRRKLKALGATQRGGCRPLYSGKIFTAVFAVPPGNCPGVAASLSSLLPAEQLCPWWSFRQYPEGTYTGTGRCSVSALDLYFAIIINIMYNGNILLRQFILCQSGGNLPHDEILWSGSFHFILSAEMDAAWIRLEALSSSRRILWMAAWCFVLPKYAQCLFGCSCQGNTGCVQDVYDEDSSRENIHLRIPEFSSKLQWKLLSARGEMLLWWTAEGNKIILNKEDIWLAGLEGWKLYDKDDCQDGKIPMEFRWRQ